MTVGYQMMNAASRDPTGVIDERVNDVNVLVRSAQHSQPASATPARAVVQYSWRV